MRVIFYRLIGKLAVPCGDLDEWALWYETGEHRVALSEIGPLTVSTVFLGLDHAFGGPPLLFETMVFGAHQQSEWTECWCERTATWGEAEAAHARAVAFAERLAAATATA